MNIKRMLATFALSGAMAIAGCVSIDSTRAKLNSKDDAEINKGEDIIYQVATQGRDSTGFATFTTKERIEYVNLTSNQRLLLRIVDNANERDVVVAAIKRLDFSEEGVAYEFVKKRFGRLYDDELKRQIISKLTQDELVELLDIARKEPCKELHDVFYMLGERLVEITNSPDILWKITQSEIYTAGRFNEVAERKLFAMLDNITDTNLVEKMLLERVGGNYGRWCVAKADQRLILMKKLPENKMIELVLSGIIDHSVNEWNEGDLTALELGVGVMSYTKDTKSAAKIASAILQKVAKYCKACTDSWMMRWDKSDEDKAKKLFAGFPVLSDTVIAALVCFNESTWKYLIDKVTEENAYNILTQGEAKYDELEVALVKKLSSSKVDMKVFAGVKTDAGKKAVLAAMPAEMKKLAQESAAKDFAAILEKARAASKETFEMQGFYLGMDWDDMKQVLSHHFPDYTITESHDGDAKDADYVIYVPRQSTPFCYASAKDKKVYLFNFGKKMLKKWYNYDVQTYMEWARKYSRETGIDMKFKMLEKDTTVYEMDMSRSYRVWFHQESYQYKHNTKEYRLTYFGEEKDFTFEGGIGGAIIKQMAAPRFRYVRGDPGSLRAVIERD